MRKEQGKCFIFLQFFLNFHETNRSKSSEQSLRQRLDYSFIRIVCLWHFWSNKTGLASIKLRHKGRKNDDSLPPSYNLKNYHFALMRPRFCIDFCFFRCPNTLFYHLQLEFWLYTKLSFLLLLDPLFLTLRRHLVIFSEFQVITPLSTCLGWFSRHCWRSSCTENASTLKTWRACWWHAPALFA